jgi:hypothetical protein
MRKSTLHHTTFRPVLVSHEPLMQVLVYKTSYELMYSLGRFQEFYENPVLAGNVFSRQDLQDWQPDYYVKWGGCNFPWHVAKEIGIVNRDKWNLDRHEVEAFINMKEDRYVVGVHLEAGKNMVDILKHERAHAFFHAFSDYQKKIRKLADQQPKITTKVFNRLRKMGYGDNVLLDEYQAYAIGGVDPKGPVKEDSQVVRYVSKLEIPNR